MFASEHWGLEPDITLLAKPMASGLPVSCVVARDQIAELERGSLAITAAGHFIGCAAGLATIEEIEKRGLAENAAEVGDHMRRRLGKMMKAHEMIGEVRGRGLLTGVEVVTDRKTKTPATNEIAMINRRAFEKGLVTAFDGLKGNVFRIMPSLTLTKEQANMGLDILGRIIPRLRRREDSTVEIAANVQTVSILQLGPCLAWRGFMRERGPRATVIQRGPAEARAS